MDLACHCTGNGKTKHLTVFCRPAVIVSYAIAAVSALLSALCYAEFATEIPIAGGAMSYTSITAGPLLGWCTCIMLSVQSLIHT